jgi:Rrf2 family protein
MLSATAEHALRAVLFVAQFPDHTTFASDTIAAALGAPRNYLSKTLQALARAGVLRSSRGPGGGFSLAVSPTELTIARVIAPFTERSKTTVCLLRNRPCDEDSPCGAHAHWNAITSHYDNALTSTTIADLIAADSPQVATAATAETN